jgi:hypothetical protein
LRRATEREKGGEGVSKERRHTAMSS